jgi:hypothetical protein
MAAFAICTNQLKFLLISLQRKSWCAGKQEIDQSTNAKAMALSCSVYKLLLHLLTIKIPPPDPSAQALSEH